MAERRINFHEFLIQQLSERGVVITTPKCIIWQPNKINDIGSDENASVHVYYQPPESLQIVYPCIIYELDDIRKVPADNKAYLKFPSYSLTYITWAADSSIIDWFVELPMCKFNGPPYESDNLYHYKYTIYY